MSFSVCNPCIYKLNGYAKNMFILTCGYLKLHDSACPLQFAADHLSISAAATQTLSKYLEEKGYISTHETEKDVFFLPRLCANPCTCPQCKEFTLFGSQAHTA